MNNAATSARWAYRRGGPHRLAVTLIELLFVIMILGILAAISLGVLAGATAQARVERTRAIITKLDQLITEKYESYKTRAVPIRVPARMTNGQLINPRLAAMYRLRALRELMRMEMPQNRNDVIIGPDPRPDQNGAADPSPHSSNHFTDPGLSEPALWMQYRRNVRNLTGTFDFSGWTDSAENAECLYLIVAAMRDGEDAALSFFQPSEIADTDGDGVPEIVDAFGEPIRFIRWPPGYTEQVGMDTQWGIAGQDDDNANGVDDDGEVGWPGSDDMLPPPTPQTRNSKKSPDPFDPLKVDPRWSDNDTTFAPFDLKPLIYSSGPDRVRDVAHEVPDYTGMIVQPQNGVNLDPNYRDRLHPRLLQNPAQYPLPWSVINDPYSTVYTPALGQYDSYDTPGVPGYADNITNHDFSEK